MEELMDISSPNQPPVEREGCLSHFQWLFAGLVLPCISTGYYRRGMQRGPLPAALVIIMLGLVSAGLGTLGLVQGMMKLTGEIRAAFASGSVPEIVIQDGVAQVYGSQPHILMNQDGMLAVIDTTGAITYIDQQYYSQGILLTRTELHVLNRQGEYQRLQLSDLHAIVNANPILINAETVENAWGQFSAILGVVVLVGMSLMNTIVRLAYVALLALLVWGGFSLLLAKTDFGSVYTVGLYASVPAMYLNYLLGQIQVNFVFLHTLLLLAIWIAALGLVFKGPVKRSEPGNLRLWRVWVGIPLLVVMALNIVFQWPQGATIVWVAAVLTLAVLITEAFFAPAQEAQASVEPKAQ